jgi:nucleoside-diphosphate-sugar epimerase
MFESALKAGPQLSSVVVTSSVAAVTNPTDVAGYEFTEADFSTYALERANEDRAQGLQTAWGLLYTASKAAAERAVWKFKKEKHVSRFKHMDGFNICLFSIY